MKNILIFSLIALIALSTSCKKILEQTPRDSTYDEAFWKNSRDAKFAVAGNYALLRDAITDKNFRYYMYGDAIAKHYFTIQYTGDGLEGIQDGNFTFQYNLNSLANWTKYYKVIAMSNILINRVTKMTDEQLSDVDDPVAFKNSILGQGYFLRALSYFMMTRVWGDVPIVTEAYDDVISAPQLARSPKAEVWKQIESDCHKAASLLSWSYYDVGDAKVTASKGSVYALLAHLYLWRATMTDVNASTPIMTDVNSADTTLTKLIAMGGYMQVDTAKYSTIYNGKSSEGIFEINIDDNTLEGSNSHIGRDFLDENYIKYAGTNPRDYVNTNYLDYHYGLSGDWYWDGNDWQWVVQYDDKDVRFRNNFDKIRTPKPLCIKYRNVNYRNQAQKLDPYLSNNIIIFRLSDMLLLKAEVAMYKNNKQGAIDIINSFRDRYGSDAITRIAPDKSMGDVWWEYIAERGKEMYLEGHLFYDLLRTKQYGQLIDWLSEERFKKEGFYWPVDPALFRNNPKLKQTPYWLGKV